MKNEHQANIRLNIKVANQILTLWERVKTPENYTLFKGSITSGKKKEDGTWENISSTFSCFVFKENIEKLDNGFQERKKILIKSGSLSVLPEKRVVQGKNGEYKETIFTNPTITIFEFDFINETENAPKPTLAKYSYDDNKLDEINDDIPF